jgi:hypothetical protein
MKTHSLLLTVVTSAVLTACGGSGGGPGNNPLIQPDDPFIRPNVPYALPVRAGDFQPLVGSGISAVVSDIFAKDLNNDSVDEVVIAGRKSQPTATLQDFNMQVYGWNTGSFTQETSSWFSGNDNQILGTEPAVRFGDFNGDGNVDMLVAPGTDSSTTGPAQVFFNSGSSTFTRSNIAMADVWGHDATVTDLNGDGRDDFIIASLNSNSLVIAFGNTDGTFSTYQPTSTSNTPGAAGVSVADYLNNGTKTIVLSDSASTGNSDIKLYSWDVSSGSVVLTELSVLPESRFYLSKWDSARAAAGNAPHEIRNITTDFNGDGKPDIVVVSLLSGGNRDPYTEVQFLQNNGGANFTDVTDSVLVDFNNNTSASYQPKLIDINKDGLMDIFLSAGDYVTDRSSYDSSRVLVASSDGKFVEKHASVFRDFWNQISASTTNATIQGMPINIVNGPNNNMYLVGTVNFTDGNNTIKTAVYASKINSSGTVTPQATADAISANWPYLTSVQVNETLARTSTSLVDGIPVVDLSQSWQPVNGLGISLNGRTGQRTAISGMLSFPNMQSALISRVSAVDGMGRDYSVNMSGMAAGIDSQLMGTNPVADTSSEKAWSLRWSPYNLSKNQAVGTVENFAITTSLSPLNAKYKVQATMVRTPTNPWLSMTGVFGHVNTSTTAELTLSRSWNNGDWARFGFLNTTTDITPGLVTHVSDIKSVYAAVGWSDQNWSVWSGIQPYVIKGSVDLKIPKYVDSSGTMHYNDVNVSIKNSLVGVTGLSRNWTSKNQTVSASFEANTLGRWNSAIKYKIKF